MNSIMTEPLTQDSFAPYGDVIEAGNGESFLINQGQCQRFHNLSAIDVLPLHEGQPAFSFFRGKACKRPLTLTMVERHPLGSQAFIPLFPHPFLVVVAGDNEGLPTRPLAFLTFPRQGINIRRNVWHGVLTPLADEADFVVVDRVGSGNNLEEFMFETPYLIRETP